MSVDAILNVFRSLDKHFTSAIPPSAATACKSLSQGQKDDPHAGIGTADAGSSAKGDREIGPVVRYWTLKFQRAGRTHYDYVEACDPLKATLVVFKRKEGTTNVQVVREINRDEFEHLTRSSP